MALTTLIHNLEAMLAEHTERARYALNDDEIGAIMLNQRVLEQAIAKLTADKPTPTDCDLLVHEWFGLSYSNYLVLPRSVMQSMPVEWQRRMVACLQEIGDASRHLDDMPPAYRVLATTPGGKFAHDPYADYERGRRRVELKAEETGRSTTE